MSATRSTGGEGEVEADPDGGSARPVAVAGAVFGVGLGAALDTVLFHLILQHHHLISGLVDPTSEAGLRTNLFADGLFLLLTIGVMGAGVARLWSLAREPRVRWAADAYVGGVVVGVALFNLFDGVVDHALLGLHHTVEPGLDAYDAAWVAVSFVLLVAGWYVVRASGRANGEVAPLED